MRDKNFDVDLLKTLNDQPMPETPLTDDEFTRVLDAACGRLPQKKPAGHRRFPWGRVAAAAVACLAVGLGSINFAAPAVAEQLPVVGSLFSWLNRGGQDDYVSLQSEQLNKYAETVESTAETADSPYTLTLGQVQRHRPPRGRRRKGTAERRRAVRHAGAGQRYGIERRCYL